MHPGRRQIVTSVAVTAEALRGERHEKSGTNEQVQRFALRLFLASRRPPS